MKVKTVSFVALSLALAACGIINPNIPGQGIRGMVLLGPHCPVMIEGEECPDTPFETDLVVTSPDGARIVMEFSSDANGLFEVLLPVGEYMISSPAGTMLPYCASNGAFILTAGQITDLIVYCDTGIR